MAVSPSTRLELGAAVVAEAEGCGLFADGVVDLLVERCGGAAGRFDLRFDVGVALGCQLGDILAQNRLVRPPREDAAPESPAPQRRALSVDGADAAAIATRSKPACAAGAAGVAAAGAGSVAGADVRERHRPVVGIRSSFENTRLSGFNSCASESRGAQLVSVP